MSSINFWKAANSCAASCRRDTKGRELMSGSENVPVALVRKLQAELIYLGLESLFQDAPQDREFGAMTVALTERNLNS